MQNQLNRHQITERIKNAKKLKKSKLAEMLQTEEYDLERLSWPRSIIGEDYHRTKSIMVHEYNLERLSWPQSIIAHEYPGARV